MVRPIPPSRPGITTWRLSRSTSPIASIKMRLELVDNPPDPQVHPGHYWLQAIDGRVRLTLGEHTILVEAGEAAGFSAMTPHAVQAIDAPAEVVMIFDREGKRTRLYRDA